MEDMEKEMSTTETNSTGAKKPYTRPNLIVHGNVEDITQVFASLDPFRIPIGPHRPPERTFS